jgi:hypothetical protein
VTTRADPGRRGLRRDLLVLYRFVSSGMSKAQVQVRLESISAHI